MHVVDNIARCKERICCLSETIAFDAVDFSFSERLKKFDAVINLDTQQFLKIRNTVVITSLLQSPQ